ncbi:cactus-binding C-terminus of cactin protein-domain-containing protein [Ochromonadaceae sp. CCMP2298]|nr:cactus-binding C-terminus of cactin protein-domain-containing protein [Ochromonadaceae sp. CCMP2298]|mmetsp:Transcript_23863/g.53015  ORF Transcript_23863/g.53015 Transcript_23863/m.53015 type:complete len:541 (-) Transcript_23863:246-1868(-)
MGKKDKRDREESDLVEAPEERARRKEAKKAEKMARSLGYSNEVNPFGDSNLLQPFSWGKKKEKDTVEGRRVEGGGRATGRFDEERKRSELIGEIEKVRARRAEREEEMAEMERLRDEEMRLREAAQYDDWQKKEEDFILAQTQQRSKIRLVENREKPIDTIAKNILLVEAARRAAEAALTGDKEGRQAREESKRDITLLELEGEMRNPIDILMELDQVDLAQLRGDVTAYLALEQSKSGKYVVFWSSLGRVVGIELGKRASETPQSVHRSVESDVAALLRGKSVRELDALEGDIERRLGSGGGSGSKGKYEVKDKGYKDEGGDEGAADVEYWELMRNEVAIQRARAQVNATHKELLTQQLSLLSAIRTKQQATLPPAPPRPEVLDEKTMDAGDREEKMEVGDEIALSGGTYWWQDKYRPRKPRYFNRVKTGWDRTKYNLTHYDHDNPPPKMIQGYKFTLFFPDLIDKQKTPKFFVEQCDEAQGGKDFVIIRFHAGPPYEDVAFKVINKEWDCHRRSGFVSVFDRGVMQLHFNFKRSFYRR